MVHDRQTNVGCAAVKFREKRFRYLYLVCNYAVRVLPRRKVYEIGTPYTGCTVGRNRDFPSLCANNEPIKAIVYPIVGQNTGQNGKNNRRKRRNSTKNRNPSKVRNEAQNRPNRRQTQTQQKKRRSTRTTSNIQNVRNNQIQSRPNPYANALSFYFG